MIVSGAAGGCCCTPGGYVCCGRTDPASCEVLGGDPVTECIEQGGTALIAPPLGWQGDWPTCSPSPCPEGLCRGGDHCSLFCPLSVAIFASFTVFCDPNVYVCNFGTTLPAQHQNVFHTPCIWQRLSSDPVSGFGSVTVNGESKTIIRVTGNVNCQCDPFTGCLSGWSAFCTVTYDTDPGSSSLSLLGGYPTFLTGNGCPQGGYGNLNVLPGSQFHPCWNSGNGVTPDSGATLTVS